MQHFLNRVRAVGVHGFVDKSQPFEVFEKAIEEVAQGRSYFSESFLQAERDEHQNPKAYHKLLSDRQQQILGLVANGKSNKEMASELDLSVRTVESYRYRMLQILELKSPKELFRFAIENGIAERTQ